ncbi:response regulator [Dermacoccaceae bacterium W4C1]
MIRVAVVDDQALVRRGFASLVDLEPDLQVVAEAEDGVAGLAAVREHRPDVVLMDIRMPGMDGLEATRQICADPELGQVRVVVLTTFDLDEYVFAALRAGAAGFLVKHTEPEELLRAIRVVAAGDSLLSPNVTRRLIHHFAGGDPEDSATVGRATHGRSDHDELLVRSLTERERAVVELVAQGRSNGEIAALWFVSQATVRTHVSRAMTKVHARDRAQLVVLAYQLGLAQPGR